MDQDEQPAAPLSTLGELANYHSIQETGHEVTLDATLIDGGRSSTAAERLVASLNSVINRRPYYAISTALGFGMLAGLSIAQRRMR